MSSSTPSSRAFASTPTNTGASPPTEVSRNAVVSSSIWVSFVSVLTLLRLVCVHLAIELGDAAHKRADLFWCEAGAARFDVNLKTVDEGHATPDLDRPWRRGPTWRVLRSASA